MIKLLRWLFCWIILGRAPKVKTDKICNKCCNGNYNYWCDNYSKKLSNPLCNNGLCYSCCMNIYYDNKKNEPFCGCILKHIKTVNNEDQYV